MATIAQKLQKLLEVKEAIRQAIIGKGQSVDSTLPFSGYPDKIAAIQTGMDTSDATAAAGDILSGKTAYVKGAKVTGNIASKGASNLTASGASVTVPAGYYPSQVSKSVSAATQATPTISVDSAGKITASATQSAGYVSAGTKSATKQLTTKAGETITPGTTQKTAVASGRYTTGAVYVAGDANLVAENIKSGVSIFGVTGSLASPNTFFTCTIKNNTSITIDVRVVNPNIKKPTINTLNPGQSITTSTCPLYPIEITATDYTSNDAKVFFYLDDSSSNCEFICDYRVSQSNSPNGRFNTALFAFSAAGTLNVIED